MKIVTDAQWHQSAPGRWELRAGSYTFGYVSRRVRGYHAYAGAHALGRYETIEAAKTAVERKTREIL